jgi:CSLREA domain-containing protein
MDLFPTSFRASERSSRRDRRRARRGQAVRVRPSLEWLEDRCLPSVFQVTTLADTHIAGQTTLREAINAANANPGPDSITFATGMTPQIVLNGSELLITDFMTITGPGGASLFVSANGPYRVLEVAAGATVGISGLSMGNGFLATGAGGAIFNAGTLSLTDSLRHGERSAAWRRHL